MNSLHLSEFNFGTIKLVCKNENDTNFRKNEQAKLEFWYCLNYILNLKSNNSTQNLRVVLIP